MTLGPQSQLLLVRMIPSPLKKRRQWRRAVNVFQHITCSILSSKFKIQPDASGIVLGNWGTPQQAENRIWVPRCTACEVCNGPISIQKSKTNFAIHSSKITSKDVCLPRSWTSKLIQYLPLSPAFYAEFSSPYASDSSPYCSSRMLVSITDN